MSQIKLTADSGGGTTSLKAPSSTTSNADVVLKLPVADGSSGQVLKTDGSGQLSFTSNAGTTINNNADNRIITGSGTANTLEGESNFTWNGSSLELTAGTGNQFPIQIRNDFTPNSQRADYASLLNATSNNTLRLGSINSNGGVTVQATRGNDSSIKHDLTLQPDGGNVGVGISPTMAAGGGLHVRGPSGHQARLHMTTSNSGDTGNDGFYIIQQGAESSNNDTNFINYETANMKFSTSGSERLRIDSSGRVHIGNSGLSATAASDDLTVGNLSGDHGITIHSATDSAGFICFGDTDTTGVGSRDGVIRYQQSDSSMRFATNGNNERMRIDSSGNCLASKSFVSKKSNDASVNTSTSSGFTANTFNVVLGQDVLESQSTYLITFFWNHQGSGQPFESYGSFTFSPGGTNPGSTGAMGPNFVPLQGAHTEQGVSKYWTFRYYSSTGQHTHGLQAAFNQSLNDANGNGQLSVHAVKLADTTTI